MFFIKNDLLWNVIKLPKNTARIHGHVWAARWEFERGMGEATELPPSSPSMSDMLSKATSWFHSLSAHLLKLGDA